MRVLITTIKGYLAHQLFVWNASVERIVVKIVKRKEALDIVR